MIAGVKSRLLEGQAGRHTRFPNSSACLIIICACPAGQVETLARCVRALRSPLLLPADGVDLD
jgi:hypothetical protein